jgi:hypothetical protein|tara:strand:+ start:1638 stop:1838 length:201 start_codon:yes stop_codon:yes gene_type:complete
MSHKGNDEIIDNERDNISTYYEMIKHFEYLLESENYQDQVYSFIIGHFEKHLTEELLQELKDSLRL